MEIGEQGLALTHAVVFARDGLLHLEDEVAGRPDIVSGRQDGGAGLDELRVGDGRTRTCVLLDHDLVAVPGELVYASRRDGDPVLVILDLARDPDLHSTSSLTLCRAGGVPGRGVWGEDEARTVRTGVPLIQIR